MFNQLSRGALGKALPGVTNDHTRRAPRHQERHADFETRQRHRSSQQQMPFGEDPFFSHVENSYLIAIVQHASLAREH